MAAKQTIHRPPISNLSRSLWAIFLRLSLTARTLQCPTIASSVGVSGPINARVDPSCAGARILLPAIEGDPYFGVLGIGGSRLPRSQIATIGRPSGHARAGTMMADFGLTNVGLAPHSIVRARYFADGSTFNVQVAAAGTIGVGGTARVLEGTIVEGAAAANELRRVALKIFPAVVDSIEKIRLRREVEVVQALAGSHAHIHRFFGLANHDAGYVILISPFMRNGDMMSYLNAHPETSRFPWILQVAEALQFLHEECNLVHGDLKCENVLITDDLRAVLADFGLCTAVRKAALREVTSTGIRILCTTRFAAPELLRDEAHSLPGQQRSKTVESDVYAFGMLVLQAFSGGKPWPELTTLQVIVRVMTSAEPHPHPGPDAVARGFDDRFWRACLACWAPEPSKRPTMSQVRLMLGVRHATESIRILPKNPPGSLETMDPPTPEPENPLHHTPQRYMENVSGTEGGLVQNATLIQSGSTFKIHFDKGRPLPWETILRTGDATLGSGKQLRIVVKPLWGSAPPSSHHLKAVAAIRHAHVLPFFGVVSVGFQMGVVSRWMKNGNLLDYRRQNMTLELKELLKLILQVVDAIEYLHVNERMVHGRLKCEQVLISDHGTALLADIGTSSARDPTEATTEWRNEIGLTRMLQFTAPELILGDQPTPDEPGRPGDIYVLGLLVLQAFTLRAPWDGLSAMTIILKIATNTIPRRPEGTGMPDAWWDVCKRCWAYNPEDRPRIQDVRRRLRAGLPDDDESYI